MEKSSALESLRRDLSAPWLRHSGRDDGNSLERKISCCSGSWTALCGKFHVVDVRGKPKK
jgi:hypothetical protein